MQLGPRRASSTPERLFIRQMTAEQKPAKRNDLSHEQRCFLRARRLNGRLTSRRVSAPVSQVEGLTGDEERGSNQRQAALRSQNQILHKPSFRGCDAVKPSTQTTSSSTAPFALFHTDAIFVIYKLVYLQRE